MTTDPALELLAATVLAARTHAAVVAAFGGPDKVAVWETAPALEAGAEGSDGFPYVEIPNVEIIGDEPVEGLDTETEETVVDDPTEAFVTVDVFSRQRPDGSGGRPEALAIVGALKTALGVELAVAGFRTVLGHFVRARHFTESDGLTAHSVVTFRYLLQPL